ncbi:hypothetical protein D3Z58_09345 [Clostridiaceae bacterium]|nr:hypothetical protein [Clostridiaceae bacterium]
MLVFWSLVSLVRNSVVLEVYLLFSVACFFTVHEHLRHTHSPPTHKASGNLLIFKADRRFPSSIFD